MKYVPSIAVLLIVILLSFSIRKSADNFAQQYGYDYGLGKGDVEVRFFNRGPYWYVGKNLVYHVEYEDGTEAYFYQSLFGYKITRIK
jgi:hypothetical protein